MMRALRIFGCLLAFAGCILADDATIAAVEIPQPVKDVILENYPKAVVISAEKRGEAKDTIYAVRFKVIETVRICDVTSDGIIKKIEDTPK